jgi:hypothetical protein
MNETFSLEKFFVKLEAFAQFRNYFEPYKLILNKVMPIEFKKEDSYLFKLGQEEGLKLGEKRGEKRGEKLGEKKNRDNMILALIKKGKMSLEDIAEVAQVDIEYVKEISKKIK